MPNSRPRPGPPSCSTAHLARRFGVSVPTVQRWVDLGHLRAWKTVGGHRRIDAESAEGFIRTQMQQRGGAAAEPVVPFSLLGVDDSADDRDLLCALVEIAAPGARVAVAANGFEALIEVGKAMPDLIARGRSGRQRVHQLGELGRLRGLLQVAVEAGAAGLVAGLGPFLAGERDQHRALAQA